MNNEIEERHAQLVRDLAKPGIDIAFQLARQPENAHALHMSLLLAGEVGELVDAVKKHVIYGRDLDRINIIEELGDIEFALSAIREWVEVNRDEVLAENMHKLMTRYPSGQYSNEDANRRADKA